MTSYQPNHTPALENIKQTLQRHGLQKLRAKTAIPQTNSEGHKSDQNQRTPQGSPTVLRTGATQEQLITDTDRSTTILCATAATLITSYSILKKMTAAAL